MFLKTTRFLFNHSAELTGTPDAALIKARLDNYLTTIWAKDALASTDVSGTTDTKSDAATALINKCILVSRGGAGYATKNNNKALLRKINFTKSDLNNVSGKTLIANAGIIFSNCDPIKALLANWNVTSADVTAVNTLLQAYIALEAAPQDVIEERSEAHNDLAVAIDTANTMLNDELDIYMGTYEITNPPLHNNYEKHRALDSQTNPTSPDATVTLNTINPTVLFTAPYDANRLFTVKNEGPETIRLSLSPTNNAEGPTIVTLLAGEKRQRLSSNLNTIGNFLIGKSMGAAATVVKVWVE